MYEKINSSNIEPIRQDEEIQWKEIRQDHPYSIWLPELEDKQSREETTLPEAESEDTSRDQENLLEKTIENNKSLVKLGENIRNRQKDKIRLEYARKHENYRILTLEY